MPWLLLEPAALDEEMTALELGTTWLEDGRAEDDAATAEDELPPPLLLDDEVFSVVEVVQASRGRSSQG